MLKYTRASDEGSFSPTHLAEKEQFTHKQATVDHKLEPGSKMVMKKRNNKRITDFPLFPPINQSTTPLNHRRDLATPYLDHTLRHDTESPYIGGFSRAHGVTTPYVAPSHYSKQELFSPLPTKDYQHRLSQMSHANVVELGRMRKEPSFNESYNKLGASSPYIERRTRIEKKVPKKQNEDDENSDKNLNLHIRSNQIGLLERKDMFRYRDNKGFRYDEPFSIRKKIEQFRRWHEEQYREKIRKLKVEVDNQYEADHMRITKATLAKHSARNRLIEENKDNKQKEETKDVKEERDENGNYKHEKEDIDNDKNDKENKESKNMDVKNEQNEKTDDVPEKAPSDKTWKTWRGVNESYAYTDVKKYIEENELMSKEKEDHIRKWVLEVEKAHASDPPTLNADKG